MLLLDIGWFVFFFILVYIGIYYDVLPHSYMFLAAKDNLSNCVKEYFLWSLFSLSSQVHTPFLILDNV